MLRHNDSHLVGYSGVDGFGQASMVAFPARAAMPRIPLLNLSAPSNGRVAASPAPLPITMLAPGMVMSPTGPTPRTIVPGAMQMPPSSGGASGAGAWWDGLSTVGKVGVVGGGALLLLGIAYGLSKTSKSSNEAFRPNKESTQIRSIQRGMTLVKRGGGDGPFWTVTRRVHDAVDSFGDPMPAHELTSQFGDVVVEDDLEIKRQFRKQSENET